MTTIITPSLKLFAKPRWPNYLTLWQALAEHNGLIAQDVTSSLESLGQQILADRAYSGLAMDWSKSPFSYSAIFSLKDYTIFARFVIYVHYARHIKIGKNEPSFSSGTIGCLPGNKSSLLKGLASAITLRDAETQNIHPEVENAAFTLHAMYGPGKEGPVLRAFGFEPSPEAQSRSQLAGLNDQTGIDHEFGHYLQIVSPSYPRASFSNPGADKMVVYRFRYPDDLAEDWAEWKWLPVQEVLARSAAPRPKGDTAADLLRDDWLR